MSVESYREMLDRLEYAEALAAIRNGVEQFDRGEGMALDLGPHALIAPTAAGRNATMTRKPDDSEHSRRCPCSQKTRAEIE
jgi:hypothetical protein